MKKKTRALLAALTILAMCAGLCSCATYEAFHAEFIADEPSYETVKIGVFEPLSGNDKKFGELEKIGIELAHSVRPTCMGKEVELIFADNESDIYVAEAKIQDLVSKEPAVILGSYGSVYSLIAGKYIEEAQIPSIAITNTNPFVTDNNPYYFRVCYIDSYQSVALAKYAYESAGLTQAAIMKPASDDISSAYAKAFEDKFVQMTGDPNAIVRTVEYPVGTTDFEAQLNIIKSLGVEAVFLPVLESDALAIMKQAHDMTVDVNFLGTDAWDTENFIAELGDASHHVVFSTDYDHEEMDSTANETFLRAYYAKYGEDAVPEPAVALAYDAYMIAVDALDRIGTVKDSELLRRSIAMTSQYPGVSGNITLDSNGDPMKTVLIEGLVNGKKTTIYIMEPAIVSLGIE